MNCSSTRLASPGFKSLPEGRHDGCLVNSRSISAQISQTDHVGLLVSRLNQSQLREMRAGGKSVGHCEAPDPDSLTLGRHDGSLVNSCSSPVAQFAQIDRVRLL